MSSPSQLLSAVALALVAALSASGAQALTLDPGSFSQLQLWLDANDVNAGGGSVANGAELTVWHDKSGNNRDAVQNGGGATPEFVFDGGAAFGGRSVVSFNSISPSEQESLVLPTGFLFNTNAFTLFVVHQTARGANQALFGPSNNFLKGLELLNADIISKPNQIRANGTEKSAGTSGWDDNVVTITTLQADATATQVFKNGVASAMTSASGVTPLNFNGRYALASYASNAGAHFANTDIAELIIYDRVLSIEERIGVETYLQSKFAPVPLPAAAWLLGSAICALGAVRRRASAA